MFLYALFICLLTNALLAKSSDDIIADVIRPRALSNEAHNEKIRSFWTNGRLNAAKPLNITLPGILNRAASSNVNVSIGPPSNVTGALPVYTGKTRRGISPTGRQVYTTGRVFWKVGGYYHTCSASVVSSKSTDLIVTAGHCVYDVSTKTWYNNNNWVFIPAYSNNNRPYGTWPARRFIIKQGYTTGDFNYDVAFVAVSRLKQRSIQSVVGSQGIGFNQPRLARIDSFGYPSNLDSGLYLKSCSGYAKASKYTYNHYIGRGLPCNMGHGCSGGPWLQNVIDATGIGYITSVNSFLIGNVPNVINGPYFETNIKSLYDKAKSM
jgi:hypothetical protein